MLAQIGLLSLPKQKQSEVPEQDCRSAPQTQGWRHVGTGGGTQEVIVEATVVVVVVGIVVVVAGVGKFKQLQAEEICEQAKPGRGAPPQFWIPGWLALAGDALLTAVVGKASRFLTAVGAGHAVDVIVVVTILSEVRSSLGLCLDDAITQVFKTQTLSP
jgi:hypothetical protein